MDIQALKENAWTWTQRVALFLLLQTSLIYLWACVVAGKPIGPVEYIRFQYHVIQWRPLRAARAVPAPALASVVAPARASVSPSENALTATPREYIRTTEKTEIRDGMQAGASVVAVLEADAPVILRKNFIHGWCEIDEVVLDGSHSPAHGFVKGRYLKPVGQ